jgi:hypothetical protein
MKRAILAVLAVLALGGCARFTATQEDISDSGRSITTRVKGVCWFSSAQHIAGVKMTQTDKTQSFGTAVIGQQGATNIAETIDSLTRLLQTLRPAP